MTPLAQAMARELTLPVKDRSFDDKAGLLALIGQDMHCFEVSAIVHAVGDAMAEDNLWPEVAGMMPRMFLPSPITWLEYADGKKRVAYVIRSHGYGYRLDIAMGDDSGMWSMEFCTFRARSPLEVGERVEVVSLWGGAAPPSPIKAAEKPDHKIKLFPDFDPAALMTMTQDQRRLVVERAVHAKDLMEARVEQLNRELVPLAAEGEMLKAANTGVVMSALLLDLINTPGVVGLRQHQPHRALAKLLGVGRFPLRGWSEVVVKTQTRVAGPAEHLSGPSFHKCLHFVRSHARHYQSGNVSVIPAHWRGDPALGIKRTRYRVECSQSSTPSNEGGDRG